MAELNWTVTFVPSDVNNADSIAGALGVLDDPSSVVIFPRGTSREYSKGWNVYQKVLGSAFISTIRKVYSLVAVLAVLDNSEI